MRIALFSDTYPPEINGVASSTYILKNELEKHGHDVYVVTTFAGEGRSKWDESEHILQLAGVELKFLYGYVMTSPFHMFAFDEIRKLNLDLIHAQTEFGVGIFARICAKQLKIPLVSTYHTTYEDYTHYVNFINSRTIDSLAKKGVAKISKLYGDSSMSVIAPSEKTKEMLQGYHIRREIDVIPTGLQLDQFHPDLKDEEYSRKIREEFGFTMDDHLVIYVGRLAEEKALDLVIRGFSLALQQGANVRLLVVGNGPDFDRLQAMVKEEGIEGKVVLAGPKPRSEVPSFYRASDAFISASLTETQGMTFIEALAAGLPLFARKDDVLDELLIEGKTGSFFKDEQDLADHLITFGNTPLEQIHKCQKDCLSVVQPYSSEVFYQRVIAVYQRVVEEYQHQYRIDDVKVKDSTVQLYLISNRKEELRLQVSIDDYYNQGMRKDGILTSKAVEELKQTEAGTIAYQSCLKKIAMKDRTCKEIYDWLSKNTECDISTINKIVDKLEEKGYLNDERYCEDQIQALKSSLAGRQKIIRTLKRHGIPFEMIVEKLDHEMEDEEENARKYAVKALHTMKNNSVRKTKNALYQKLVQQGYAGTIASHIVDQLDYSPVETKEVDNLRKCAAKAMRKYSRKYEGTELRNHIYRYCATQGYDSEDIYVILDEME